MKLLVSDLDGTLFPIDHDEAVFKANIEAVQKWVKSGNLFAIATGRGKEHIPETEELLGMSVPFIGSNGAEMVLFKGKEIIKEMPYQIFYEICEYLEKEKLEGMPTTSIYDDWCYVKREGYPWTDPNFRVDWSDAIEIDYKAYAFDVPIPRMQIFVPEEKREDLKERIKALNYPVHVNCSDFDLVDIGPLDATKGLAALALCKEYNIPVEDLIVVGDSENDLPMLEITKNSYCMMHSNEEVKSTATYARNSVAEIIEELLEK